MEHKILIVDDEKQILKYLRDTLLKQGFHVESAESGEEAVDAMNRDQFDLALLDIKMPGISGLDVLKHIKDKYKETKVVMLTGFDEYEDEAKRLGCDAFLVKPLSFVNLKDTLFSLLEYKENQEVIVTSMGVTSLRAKKGSPMADILLLEPLEPVHKLLVQFLEGSESGGYYKVHHVVTSRNAFTLQQILRTSIVMIDVRSVPDAVDVLSQLSKNPHPPKEFIYYFENRKTDGKIKIWNGNPTNPDDLKNLAQMIKNISLEHGLIKK